MALLNISALIRSRRSLVALAVVVPLVGAAIAVPALFSGDPTPDAPSARQSAPKSAATIDPVAEDEGVAEAIDAEAQPHADGDLDLTVGLRFDRYPAGSRIRAEIDVVNMSLEPVFLPAPSEPQPTLTIVVLDDQGHTVRRVVEETGDATPRRMRQLASGATTSFHIDVVARDEEPLEPGTYYLVASYDTADAWRRSGLDVWTAPKGTLHSDRVALEVTPAQE